MMKYVNLAFIWFAWCFIHSALISETVTGYFRHRFAAHFRYHRLVYNGVAVFTLLPVVLYTTSLQTHPLFCWQGYWRGIQFLLIFIPFLLFLSGSRYYDALSFLGVRQLRQSNSCIGMTENCELETTGLLGIVRHPWYTGGMMIVWARDIDISAIVTNLIITVYFIVGTVLEERRLSIEFGEGYKEYQKRVSMFFPFKWLKSKLNAIAHRK